MHFVFDHLGQILNQSKCPNEEDFFPCGCPYKNKNFYEVICEEVPLEKVEKVFTLTTAADVSIIVLRLIKTDTFIPSHIFGKHKVPLKVELFGNRSFPEKMRLKIHPEAFQYSADSTKQLKIYYFNLELLEFHFLSFLKHIEFLSIYGSSNFHLSHIPSMPGLKQLQIAECIGLNEWIDFPILSIALESIDLKGNRLTDEGADRILKWVREISQATDTLQNVELSRNALTQIPYQLQHFPRLHTLSLENQQNPGLGYISNISFNTPISFLNLDNCHIKHIDRFNFNQGRNYL